jgi:hypothetical protein
MAQNGLKESFSQTAFVSFETLGFSVLNSPLDFGLSGNLDLTVGMKTRHEIKSNRL